MNWPDLCTESEEEVFFLCFSLFFIVLIPQIDHIFFPSPDRLMNVNFWLVFLWHQNAVTIKERQISSGNADINKRENRFNYPIPNWKSHRNSALIQPNSAAFWLKFILNPSNTWLKFNQDLNQIWAKSVEDMTKDWFEFIQKPTPNPTKFSLKSEPNSILFQSNSDQDWTQIWWGFNQNRTIIC